MKVCVLGAGGMGCLVGTYLKKGGAEVHLVDPYEEHMKAVAENGLKIYIEDVAEQWTVHFDSASTSSEHVGFCDLVVMLHKGTSTREELAAHMDLIGENTVVATFQNGVGHTDIIAEFVKKENIGYGILNAGGNFNAPGDIYCLVTGGPKNEPLPYGVVVPGGHAQDVLDEMAAILKSAGMNAGRYENLDEILWTKLWVNSMWNIPLAVMRVSVEDALRNEELSKLLWDLGEEICQVAAAKGFEMNNQDQWDKYCVPMINKPTHFPRYYTSAAQDTMKKRPTEVDFFNGAVAREGKKLGISTPINEMFWKLGRAYMQLYDVQF